VSIPLKEDDRPFWVVVEADLYPEAKKAVAIDDISFTKGCQ
jgi:hypothetical protein